MTIAQWQHAAEMDAVSARRLAEKLRNAEQALKLGWTWGQYQWAHDRFARYDEDYLAPNGMTRNYGAY